MAAGTSIPEIALTQAEFDRLPDYSATIPTGTTIGKRWKRGEPYCEPVCWFMGEYVEDPDPKMVGIRWKRIIVLTPRQAQVRKALA